MNFTWPYILNAGVRHTQVPPPGPPILLTRGGRHRALSNNTIVTSHHVLINIHRPPNEARTMKINQLGFCPSVGAFITVFSGSALSLSFVISLSKPQSPQCHSLIHTVHKRYYTFHLFLQYGAKKDQVSRLLHPTTTTTTTMTFVLDCPICLEKLQVPVAIPCGKPASTF